MLSLPIPCVYFTLIQPRNDLQTELSWDLIVAVWQMRQEPTVEGKVEEEGKRKPEKGGREIGCALIRAGMIIYWRYCWWASLTHLMVKKKERRRETNGSVHFQELLNNTQVLVSYFWSKPRSSSPSSGCPTYKSGSGADLTNPSTIVGPDINY